MDIHDFKWGFCWHVSVLNKVESLCLQKAASSKKTMLMANQRTAVSNNCSVTQLGTPSERGQILHSAGCYLKLQFTAFGNSNSRKSVLNRNITTLLDGNEP